MIRKISMIFGLVSFGLGLLVLMVVPMLAGQTIASHAVVVAQAGAIAVSLALVFAWFLGLTQGAGVPTAAPSDDQIEPFSRADSGADIDPVTRTLNQRGLTVKLLETMALGERYGNEMAVAIIGVDHLSEVREKYGEAVANKALCAIAGELGDTLRMPDRLGRWSDDELIAILPETSLDGARHIGERLREAASRAQFEAKHKVVLTLTASIGVTMFRMGDDLQGLLGRAIRAMNTAQQQGCNRVFTDLAA